jgi:general secretion pathway protein C
LLSASAWMDELKSGQGLARLAASRGPQLLAISLLLLLGLDSALILARAFSRSSALPPASASGSAAAFHPAVNPTLQLAMIVNAHLFGNAGSRASGEAPQTTMPLILAGVIADKDPAKGQAILGESAVGAKLYVVGGAIPGGAHLHAVYADRVLLERNGGLETLMLPRTSRAAGLPGTAGPAPARLTQSSAAANPTLLAGLVRIQPVFNQGKLQGYRIFPGGGRGTSAFSQLGLRSGDLIQAVNGTALDDAGRAAEVLQTLSSSATATVTVSRNGQPQELNLNLATLNVEPDAGDNTPGSSPANDAAAGPGQPGPNTPGPRFRPGAANLGAAPGSGQSPGSNINPPSTGPE